VNHTSHGQWISIHCYEEATASEVEFTEGVEVSTSN
jgi:hypothetical protein